MNRKRILIVFAIVIFVCTILPTIYHKFLNNQNIDLLSQITQGDFASLEGLEEEQLKYLNWLYERHRDMDRMQWIYVDVNDDGMQELIWQEKDCVADSQAHRITAIFAVTQEGCRRVLWDVNDMSEFYFCDNDKIIYTNAYQGVYDYEYYGVCEYDRDWEHTVERFYEIYNIYDLTEYDAMNLQSQFDWMKDAGGTGCVEGEYYIVGTQEEDGSCTRVLLGKEEWLEQFESDIRTFTPRLASGVVGDIRAEDGNLRYEYFSQRMIGKRFF